MDTIEPKGHGKGSKGKPPKEEKYIFFIDGSENRFEWDTPEITGAELMGLVNVDPSTHEIWLEVKSDEDRPIAPNETVRLDRPGVERFFTGISETTEG